MAQKFTPAQIADIQEREKKALDFLKELQLTPAAIVTKEKIGHDTGKEVWADVVIPYLQDFKFTDASKDEGIPTSLGDCA